MGGYIDRFDKIRENIAVDHEERLRKKGSDNPIYWGLYVLEHRKLAIAAYVLDHDVQSFYEHLHQAVEYAIKDLTHDRENGNATDAGVHGYLFDALALGDVKVIKNIHQLFDHVNVERLSPAQHVTYIVRTFRYLILGAGGDKNDPELLLDHCIKRKKTLVGYGICLKAIIAGSVSNFESGFAEVMKGHKRLTSDSADELLAMRPLGLVNLARLKGLDVHIDHKYVPGELITKNLGGL